MKGAISTKMQGPSHKSKRLVISVIKKWVSSYKTPYIYLTNPHLVHIKSLRIL